MTEGIGESDSHQSEGEEKGPNDSKVFDLPLLEADPCNPKVVREEDKMESDLPQNENDKKIKDTIRFFVS